MNRKRAARCDLTRPEKRFRLQAEPFADTNRTAGQNASA